MTYTPAAGYTGPDQFTYTAGDGRTITGPTALHLQVVPVTPPTCQTPAPIAVRPTRRRARSVPVSCSDPRGDPYDDRDRRPAGPRHGHDPRGLPAATTPTPATQGPDSFSYHAESVNGSSATVTQADHRRSQRQQRRRTASPGPSRSSRASRASFTVPCFDADNDQLSFEVTTRPSTGRSSPQSGTGALTYTANPTYHGAGPVHGRGRRRPRRQPTRARSSMNVSNVNTPPSCPPSVTITAQSGVPLSLVAAVLRRGRRPADVRGRRPRPTTARSPRATASAIYTSNAGYTGPDQFTFRANDGQANSEITTVNVNVTPAPGPVCQSRSYSVATDATLDVDLDCFAERPEACWRSRPRRRPPPARSGRSTRRRQRPLHADAGLPRHDVVHVRRQLRRPDLRTRDDPRSRSPATGSRRPSSRRHEHVQPRTGIPVTFSASRTTRTAARSRTTSWFVDGAAVRSSPTATQLTRSFADRGQPLPCGSRSAMTRAT